MKKVKDTEDENKYWKLKQEHVGNKQLSQMFMVKLKDWEHTKTEFGLIKKLDELVFDLYDLNIIEKDLVNDFFIKSDARVEETDLKEYCQIFYEVFQFHLKKDRNLFFQVYQNQKNPLGLVGIQIKVEKLNSSRRSFQETELSDAVQYIMKSISENLANTNLLTLQEQIVANNSIYIIREENLKNWSRSRAVEDAKYVLRRFQK